MYEYGCTVERVVDGDTIDVVLDLGFDIRFKSRVRLYGIDTPESRTRDKDEKVRGKMAGAFLKDAVNNGSKVVIETKLKDSRGKYGRVLGEIFIEDKDGKQLNINKTLISEGHAYKYEGGKKKVFTS